MSIQDIKILHLSKDEKFIDMGFSSFERCGFKNDLIVFTEKACNYVKTTPISVKSLKDVSYSSLREYMTKYDIVVLHSRFTSRLSFPKSVRVIWLGFGYDYYRYINKKLILPTTLKNIDKAHKSKVHFFVENIKDGVSRVISYRNLSSIDIFAPVLVDEFDMINLPKFFKPKICMDWNYGTLEDDLIRGFEGKSINGNSILVGNSATATNNHFEVLNILKKIGVEERKVVVPLSYGDDKYAKSVEIFGKELFHSNFLPLLDFMGVDEYLKVLQGCSVVIMNHLRQQALGNIIIALYLGAKVYLNMENPVFSYLQRLGFVIFSIDEISVKSISENLSEKDRESNREKLYSIMSRDVIDRKTKKLVERAMTLKI